MIKTNELRLGNWIQNAEGEKIPVTEIYSDMFRHSSEGRQGSFGYFNMLPVELTVDILIKSGAENTNSNPDTFDIKYGPVHHLILQRLTQGFKLIISRPKVHYEHEFPILYLHELQNWYFLISKKELSIRIPIG